MIDDSVTGVIICLLFSAFFSGIEIAFVSSDPLHLKIQSTKEDSQSRILAFFIQRPAIFITTALIGNTIALVVYGMYMARILDPILHLYLHSTNLIMIIETIASTIVVLITAEFLPKVLFIINPNKMVAIGAYPMFIMVVLFYPFVFVVVQVSKFIIINIFKSEYSEEKPIYGYHDLNNFIHKVAISNEELLEETVELDAEIFSNALEFKKVRVRDCMIPRTELVAVDIEDNIEILKQAFIDSGHSKVFIYKQSIDDIRGFCHSSQLFKKPETIEEIMQDTLIVTEPQMADDLMFEFIKKHKSIALVVDEFGGTSGVVTIEDIIEEIFGEIQDEHDDEDLIEHKIDDNNFILSGRHEIDYLNETYFMDLPEGDYDTLGGLILSEFGEIPKSGSIVDIDHFKIIIRQMKGLKIERVQLTLKPRSKE